MQAIEEKIGYSFRDAELLTNALTHSSYANENRGRSCESNERLEFSALWWQTLCTAASRACRRGA